MKTLIDVLGTLPNLHTIELTVVGLRNKKHDPLDDAIIVRELIRNAPKSVNTLILPAEETFSDMTGLIRLPKRIKSLIYKRNQYNTYLYKDKAQVIKWDFFMDTYVLAITTNAPIHPHPNIPFIRLLYLCADDTSTNNWTWDIGTFTRSPYNFLPPLKVLILNVTSKFEIPWETIRFLCHIRARLSLANFSTLIERRHPELRTLELCLDGADDSNILTLIERINAVRTVNMPQVSYIGIAATNTVISQEIRDTALTMGVVVMKNRYYDSGRLDALFESGPCGSAEHIKKEILRECNCVCSRNNT